MNNVFDPFYFVIFSCAHFSRWLFSGVILLQLTNFKNIIFMEHIHSIIFVHFFFLFFFGWSVIVFDCEVEILEMQTIKRQTHITKTVLKIHFDRYGISQCFVSMFLSFSRFILHVNDFGWKLDPKNNTPLKCATNNNNNRLQTNTHKCRIRIQYNSIRRAF